MNSTNFLSLLLTVSLIMQRIAHAGVPSSYVEKMCHIFFFLFGVKLRPFAVIWAFIYFHKEGSNQRSIKCYLKYSASHISKAM